MCVCVCVCVCRAERMRRYSVNSGHIYTHTTEWAVYMGGCEWEGVNRSGILPPASYSFSRWIADNQGVNGAVQGRGASGGIQEHSGHIYTHTTEWAV